MITLDVVNVVIIPFVAGVFIPFVTTWVSQFDMPEQLETFLNIAFSALAAAIPSVVFSGSWTEFAVAVIVAWIGTARTYVANWLPTQRDGRHSLD